MFKFSFSSISERKEHIAEITPTSVTHGRTFDGKETKFAAAHAVDKDLSTKAATHIDNGAGWLKLQFGGTYFMNKVVIYNGFYNNWYNPDDWCAISEVNFKVCVDNGNNVDVSVYQGEVQQKSCGTLRLTYGLEQSDQIYTLLCNVEGDTVKLSKSSGNTIVVTEVVVTSTGKLNI